MTQATVFLAGPAPRRQADTGPRPLSDDRLRTGFPAGQGGFASVRHGQRRGAM